MDRRRFLQNLAVATASVKALAGVKSAAASETDLLDSISRNAAGSGASAPADIEGHTFICEFKPSAGSASWKAYEDLRTRDGVTTFVSSDGRSRVLTRSADATFVDPKTPPYLGLTLDQISASKPDLLAERLLRNGDPDPEAVKTAAPPQGTEARTRGGGSRLGWTTFVGTRQSFDTAPIFAGGSTRSYGPGTYMPDMYRERSRQRFDGLLGGWMPAVRSVMPVTNSTTAYYETVVFGDVEAHDEFIVQTWHRTVRVEDGKVTQSAYAYSYPDYPPSRMAPSQEQYYRALFVFANYWDKLLADIAPASLPDNDLADMAKHCFAKEIMVRPAGVYPKYGAVDRDYYGSEYDGFQDIFTMATYTNLEWGRFQMSRDIIENFYSENVDDKGVNNMRGPETAHFGLTLSLLARYYNYTGDSALLLKHREKVEATAGVLTSMHDISLKVPQEDPSYGIIRGWSESDSCLDPKPMTWWLPYFANNASAARGLKDFALAWQKIGRAQKSGAMQSLAADWLKRSKTLQDTCVAAMRKDVRANLNPPYVGPFPGVERTFFESRGTPGAPPTAAERENANIFRWVHRPYTELLQADMLPADLANLNVDCMKAYGLTTMGVVGGNGGHRSILGFISYGYAQMLLRLDRIEEYLLFLYAHRYHDHTRGSWVAGEVSGISGGNALFCIPAQQTIPLLVRWMLVLEDNDEDRLYLAKGVPRAWLGSGKEISIANAPTRWGKVSLKLAADTAAKKATATVALTGARAPRELYVKFRLPVGNALQSVTANGATVLIGGEHNDTAIVPTKGARRFNLIAQFS